MKESNASSIQVICAMFAVLIGIGLQQILSLRSSSELFEFRKEFFLIALLLTLRLMTGSANHLWLEHVKLGQQKSSKFRLIRDLTALIIMGTVSVFMCYSDTVAEFFQWACWLQALSVIWCVIAVFLGNPDSGEGENVLAWFIISALLLICFLVCAITLAPGLAGSMHRHHLQLLIGLASVACILDFYVQLKMLERTQSQSSSDKNGGS